MVMDAAVVVVVGADVVVVVVVAAVVVDRVGETELVNVIGPSPENSSVTPRGCRTSNGASTFCVVEGFAI